MERLNFHPHTAVCTCVVASNPSVVCLGLNQDLESSYEMGVQQKVARVKTRRRNDTIEVYRFLAIFFS